MMRIFKFIAVGCLPLCLYGQKQLNIEVTPVPAEPMLKVTAAGKAFAEFIYPDTLEKPVLFDIHAPDGATITRGYPLAPRSLESTDHPHHIGLWLNYENVNGLDFWNNSFAIPKDKKHLYGWIKTDSVVQLNSGVYGTIGYYAHWEDWQKKRILIEFTEYVFSADQEKRIIDRYTSLTALEDVSFPDAKDGMIGLRVTRELQLPSQAIQQFSDNKGNKTTVSSAADGTETGNYLTSANKTGNEAWGTRAAWCLLYGKMNRDSISIAIIDHPKNPGYPTYWHARGYGLFAANPLGQNVFSNGKETLDFKMKKGSSVIFRYRIVIASGNSRISNELLDKLALQFAAK